MIASEENNNRIFTGISASIEGEHRSHPHQRGPLYGIFSYGEVNLAATQRNRQKYLWWTYPQERAAQNDASSDRRLDGRVFGGAGVSVRGQTSRARAAMLLMVMVGGLLLSSALQAKEANRAATTVDPQLVPCGNFSTVLMRSNDLQYLQKPETRLAVMQARWESLKTTAAGYERTRISLVGFDGEKLVASARTDDVGLDYFVPRVSTVARVSLATAVDIFLISIVAVGFASGIMGLLLTVKTFWGRLMGIVELILLALYTLLIGDVYVVQSSIVVGVVPWALYAASKRIHPLLLVAGMGPLGLILGLANVVRSQAGTVVFLFVFVLAMFSPGLTRRSRVMGLMALTIGLMIPQAGIRRTLNVRDRYLGSVQADYVRPPGQHPLWHSVYIGMGFLSNPYVPGGYCDEVAIQAVRAVDPQATFLSPEYDHALKQRLLELFRQRPTLVVLNVLAKVGILEALALVAANVGLWAAFRHRGSRWIVTAFAVAILFGFVPGILVIPVPRYVLGALSLLVLFGVMSVDDYCSARLTARTSAG